MSFLSNLFGGGPSNNQKTANNQLNGAANAGINTGLSYLGNSQQAFQAPTSYYSSILSGNPASVAGALSPEISALNSGYANNRVALDQFAPMGGGRAEAMAQLPFQRSGAITNLIAQERANAAQGLTGLGTTQGAIGQSLLGTGVQAANAFDVNAAQQHLLQQQTGMGIGSAIGNLLTGGLLGSIGNAFGKIFGGGGSDSSGFGTYPSVD